MWCRLKDPKKPNYCNQLQSLIKIAEIKAYENILSTASYSNLSGYCNNHQQSHSYVKGVSIINYAGLMIISCGRRTAKFRQIHKIPRNSQKHARYRNIFGTYLSYWCCSIAANLRIYLETSKQHPKTTRRKLCCKKLGTSHDIKSFAIGSFLDVIVVERANDYVF